MENDQIIYTTEAEYDAAMDEIYELMNRGESKAFPNPERQTAA